MPYKDPDKRRDAVKRSKAKRGDTIDRLISDVQDAGDLPEPPSRDFLLRALGVQAREGNIPAIRLLLEEYRRDGEQHEEEQPLAKYIELDRHRRSA